MRRARAPPDVASNQTASRGCRTGRKHRSDPLRAPETHVQQQQGHELGGRRPRRCATKSTPAQQRATPRAEKCSRDSRAPTPNRSQRAQGTVSERPRYSQRAPKVQSASAQGTVSERPRYSQRAPKVQSASAQGTVSERPRYSSERPRYSQRAPKVQSASAQGTVSERPRYSQRAPKVQSASAQGTAARRPPSRKPESTESAIWLANSNDARNANLHLPPTRTRTKVKTNVYRRTIATKPS